MLGPPHELNPDALHLRAVELAQLSETLAVDPSARVDVRGELSNWLKLVADTLVKAERHWSVGTALPKMSGRQGLLKALGVPVAKTILRVAQVVTRDQREFNYASLAAMESLSKALGLFGPLLADEVDARLEGAKHETKKQLEALEKRLQALEQQRKP